MHADADCIIYIRLWKVVLADNLVPGLLSLKECAWISNRNHCYYLTGVNIFHCLWDLHCGSTQVSAILAKLLKWKL